MISGFGAVVGVLAGVGELFSGLFHNDQKRKALQANREAFLSGLDEERETFFNQYNNQVNKAEEVARGSKEAYRNALGRMGVAGSSEVITQYAKYMDFQLQKVLGTYAAAAQSEENYLASKQENYLANYKTQSEDIYDQDVSSFYDGSLSILKNLPLNSKRKSVGIASPSEGLAEKTATLFEQNRLAGAAALNENRNRIISQLRENIDNVGVGKITDLEAWDYGSRQDYWFRNIG